MHGCVLILHKPANTQCGTGIGILAGQAHGTLESYQPWSTACHGAGPLGWPRAAHQILCGFGRRVPSRPSPWIMEALAASEKAPMESLSDGRTARHNINTRINTGR